MSENYQDWCYLNEEGMKQYKSIFPRGKLPIVSMLPITFNHPTLEDPEKAYLLRGSDLTPFEVRGLIVKISENFNEENTESIKKAIYENQIPIRLRLTNGSGTKRIYAYLD
jgi:hypothetical protein